MWMEKKSVRCPYQFKDQIIDFYSLFGFQFDEVKNYPFGRCKLSFHRDGFDDGVKEAENKYRLRPFLTYYPVAAACLLVLVLATLFLVFAFKGGENRFTYFLYFMVPTFALLPLIAVYTYVRYHFDSKNLEMLTSLRDIKKELEK